MAEFICGWKKIKGFFERNGQKENITDIPNEYHNDNEDKFDISKGLKNDTVI